MRIVHKYTIDLDTLRGGRGITISSQPLVFEVPLEVRAGTEFISVIYRDDKVALYALVHDTEPKVVTHNVVLAGTGMNNYLPEYPLRFLGTIVQEREESRSLVLHVFVGELL